MGYVDQEWSSKYLFGKKKHLFKKNQYFFLHFFQINRKTTLNPRSEKESYTCFNMSQSMNQDYDEFPNDIQPGLTNVQDTVCVIVVIRVTVSVPR